MNELAIKAKTERWIKEIVEETDLFASLERALDGSPLLAYKPKVGETLYVEVSSDKIEPPVIAGKNIADVRLPERDVSISCTVFEKLKPGAALNKFVANRAAFQLFTCVWLTEVEADETVRMRLESRHVGDTIDKIVFVNGLLHLLEDIEYIRAALPASVHATGTPVY